MKRIIALFLALTLCSSFFALDISAEPVYDDLAVVNVYSPGGIISTKAFNVGDMFTVYTSLDLADLNNGNVSSFSGTQTFDPSVLSLANETDEYGMINDPAEMLPVAGSLGMAAYNVEGTLKFNATNPFLNNGFVFNSPESYLLISTYIVKAPGVVDINTSLTTLALSDTALTRVINKSEVKEPYTPDQVIMISDFEGFTPPPEPFMLGDANGDNEVDTVDSTIVQRVATHVKVPYDEAQLMHADVDSDGALSVLDATFIQRYATHAKVPFPVGEPVYD